MMGKQRLKAGSLVRVDLADGHVAFGRVLEHSEIGFYDYFIQMGEPPNPPDIYAAGIAFILTVMDKAVKSGRWQIIDERPLELDLQKPRDYFVMDGLSGKYSIYRSSDGNVRAATSAECEGLERASVWQPEHIEERLRDHFVGRKNLWAEKLKSELAP